MTDFTLYTPENAPEASKPLLSGLENKYGIVPNIFAHMAESPLPIELYGFGQDLAMSKATLGAEKVNIVQLAISVFNQCRFCVAAHSTIAKGQLKTDAAIVDAIRNETDGPDNAINALVRFTQVLAEKRGQVSDADTQAFLDAGFTKAQIFEVLTIIAYKTLTNYTSQLAGTQPNEAFAAEAWEPKGKRAA